MEEDEWARVVEEETDGWISRVGWALMRVSDWGGRSTVTAVVVVNVREFRVGVVVIVDG
jgi:hypothetical protein